MCTTLVQNHNNNNSNNNNNLIYTAPASTSVLDDLEALLHKHAREQFLLGPADLGLVMCFLCIFACFLNQVVLIFMVIFVHSVDVVLSSVISTSAWQDLFLK